MVKLTKQVIRETDARYGARTLVVKLTPTHIEIREKRRREWFSLPISQVYLLAAEQRVRDEKEAKRNSL